MLQMLNAGLTMRALCVAAELKIADRLAPGPRTLAELATATGAHQQSLGRLLRLLAGAGVFREMPDGQIALTPLGQCLRSDSPDSVRDWALYLALPSCGRSSARCATPSQPVSRRSRGCTACPCGTT